VRFDVRVSLIDWGLDAQGVFRDTTINRPLNVGITITPTAALLDPGTQASFQATVTGVSNTAVTWTATGGTFTIAGNTLNYTAGSTPGTYHVTARSVANPSKTVTAQIEIVGQTVVYSNDFSTAINPGWSHQGIQVSPTGQRYLGDFQRETVNLSLNALATHSKVEVEFDFYTISDWEGSAPESAGGIDIITFLGDGQTLLVTTFSTKQGFLQAFPGSYPGALNAPMTGATAIASLGFPGSPGDATYRLKFTVPHTAPNFIFSIVGALHLAGPTGERFGIDNVRVKIIH
jgi:hypothetical protein